MILFALLIVGSIAALAGGYLKKHSGAGYLVSAMLSLFTVYAVWSPLYKAASPLLRTLLSLLTNGTLAGALFLVVMLAGALPRGSYLMRRWMALRGELSIMASILVLGHNIAYGKTYFVLLFGDIDKLLPNQTAAAIVSLLMIALMLPLWITSFQAVRRRMAPKSWKRLQRLAYPFYLLMYLHVLLLFGGKALEVSAHLNYTISLGLYTLIYLLYAVLKALRLSEKRGCRLLMVAAALVSVTGITLAGLFTAQALYQQPMEPAAVSAAPTVHLEGTYKDGVYTGKGKGYNDAVHVEIEITDNTIRRIDVTGHMEDEPYIYWVINGYIPQILKQQNLDVDAVSDATATSIAVRKAVKQALDKAKTE